MGIVSVLGAAGLFAPSSLALSLLDLGLFAAIPTSLPDASRMTPFKSGAPAFPIAPVTPWIKGFSDALAVPASLPTYDSRLPGIPLATSSGGGNFDGVSGDVLLVAWRAFTVAGLGVRRRWSGCCISRVKYGLGIGLFVPGVKFVS